MTFLDCKYLYNINNKKLVDKKTKKTQRFPPSCVPKVYLLNNKNISNSHYSYTHYSGYHFFFCSSKLAPPGPKATTNSSPPITDMVWKKSYFKKSRIAFHCGTIQKAFS